MLNSERSFIFFFHYTLRRMTGHVFLHCQTKKSNDHEETEASNTRRDGCDEYPLGLDSRHDRK